MNKNRKGFTIVELVIVIAIIAILAAVLIPTFASLIAKANVSADTQLVRNLNTALTTEKAGGENNKTMNDALKMAKNAGYDIDRIVSKSGNNIGWDSKNDRFVLIDAGNNTFIYPTDAGANAQKIADADMVNYFVISKTVPATTDQKYSIYLSKDATLADGTVTVSVGFDAGENTNVKTVTYTSDATQNVIIRTNGGTLTVNGAESSVDHYGAANLIDIEKVKDASFHEFGSAAVVTVTSGRFVAESTAKVLRVHAAASTAKLAEVSGANVVEYTKAANVEVTVENSTKKVAEASETLDAIKNTGKNTELVAEGGVAEINGIQFKDLQSAFNAANDGDTIKVLDNIDLALTASVKKVTVTLDMNGKTITNTSDLWDVQNKDAANWSLVSVKEGGNLTITGNGAFKAKANDCYAVDIQDGSKCTIENGIFVGNISAVYVLEGELTVNGGTYSVQQKYSDATKADEFVLNCYDANREAKTAIITVTGGTFIKFNPANCKAEGANTNFCADGYTTEKSQIPSTTALEDVQYTVVKKAN